MRLAQVPTLSRNRWCSVRLRIAWCAAPLPCLSNTSVSRFPWSPWPSGSVPRDATWSVAFAKHLVSAHRNFLVICACATAYGCCITLAKVSPKLENVAALPIPPTFHATFAAPSVSRRRRCASAPQIRKVIRLTLSFYTSMVVRHSEQGACSFPYSGKLLHSFCLLSLLIERALPRWLTSLFYRTIFSVNVSICRSHWSSSVRLPIVIFTSSQLSDVTIER